MQTKTTDKLEAIAMITTHVTHAIREVVVRKVFKLLCYLFFVILSVLESKAQTTYNEGVVTYFNSENIYVRFDHAQSLRVNDTLEIFTQNQWVKGLLVKAISSKSCHSKYPWKYHRIEYPRKICSKSECQAY
jgi:hypothetical protein